MVTQCVASDLLLSKDADRRLGVKRLLSLWNDCNITMLAKGNTTAEELVSLLLNLTIQQLTQQESKHETGVCRTD